MSRFARPLAVVAVSATALLAGNGTARALELLADPDFESASLSPAWTLGHTDPLIDLATSAMDGYNAQSGTHFVTFGNITEDTLNQTFTDTAGEEFNLSGYLDTLNVGTGAASNWSMAFNGSTCATAASSGGQLVAKGYTQYTCSDLITTGTDTVTISFEDIPGAGAMDDFTALTVPATVPEPASLLLLGSGLLGLGLARRRRRGA